MSILPLLQAPASPAPPRFLWHYCGYNVTAARHNNFKFHFATANWTSTYTPSPKCIQCCPDGPTSFNGTGGTLCDCAAKDLIFHDPPLIFDMTTDWLETTPLTPSTMPSYQTELAAVAAALREHYAGMQAVPDQMHSPVLPALEPCCNGVWPLASCECSDYVPGHVYP